MSQRNQLTQLTQLTPIDWEQERRAAIQAARAAHWRTEDVQPLAPPRQEPRQPVVIRTGFGTGAVTVLVIVGIFALGWQVVTRMDPGGLAFLAGSMITLALMIVALFVVSWLNDPAR